MKRALLLPLIVLMLVSMACSMIAPGTNATEKPTVAEPTSTVVKAAEATATQPAEQPVEPTKPPEPTATEAPKAEPTKPEATPTEAGPVEFTDTFDRVNKDWSDMLIVTTQAQGRDPYVKVNIQNGFLRFALDEKETYAYKFYQKPIEGSQTVEIDFQNKGASNYGLAVVCKANPEMTKWYEVRYNSYDNFLFVSLYDKKRKTDEGKNPYLSIGKFHPSALELSPQKPNHLKVTCSDAELLIDVNNGKKTFSQGLDTQLTGNMVGIGVMSFDVPAATVDVDTFTVRAE